MSESLQGTDLAEFRDFGKLYRLYREVLITEKIDGTNSQVTVLEDGRVLAGSRNQWITPTNDNFGFARWVEDNRAELVKLGPGRHFGEWWGAGIQRRYGLKEKRFSLFNVARWGDDSVRPACCHVVPVLYRGVFSDAAVASCLARLEREGSAAAPGFMQPEGVVVYHVPSGHGYKITLGGDGHKGDAR